MTTNNKWEEKTKDEVESFVISILDAENQTEQNQAVEDFMELISKIEQEAYNRGKEEMFEQIIEIKNQNTERLELCRQETLEKVKEKVKKVLEPIIENVEEDSVANQLINLIVELNKK